MKKRVPAGGSVPTLAILTGYNATFVPDIFRPGRRVMTSSRLTRGAGRATAVGQTAQFQQEEQ